MNAFDFTVRAQDGSDVELSQFKGKALLIINTATGCGFTPQYTELQEIYEELHDASREIMNSKLAELRKNTEEMVFVSFPGGEKTSGAAVQQEQGLLNEDHAGGCILFEKREQVEGLL